MSHVLKVIHVLKNCTRGGFVSRGSLLLERGYIYTHTLQAIYTSVEAMLRNDNNIQNTQVFIHHKL